MVDNLYLVSHGAQKPEIDEYCFMKCGKILIGGIDYMGGLFFPCKTDDCRWTEDVLHIGESELTDGEMVDLTIRKLKNLDAGCGEG